MKKWKGGQAIKKKWTRLFRGKWEMGSGDKKEMDEAVEGR